MSRFAYSVDALTRLCVRKARKGFDPTRVDPTVDYLFRQLADTREKYLDSQKRLAGRTIALQAMKEWFVQKRKHLRKKRDKAVDAAIYAGLTTFESEIQTQTFSWGLTAGPILPKESSKDIRPTFLIPQALERALPHIQASEIVRRAANLSPQSRNSIVRALQHTLGRGYGHSIIKLDIRSFFESIPHEKLLVKLRANQAIDSTTMHLVECLLQDYRTLSGASCGVPQGVGLSSQLAELYMSDFDKQIRSHSGVIFYSRYVDDVVIVLDSEQSRAVVGTSIDAQLSQLGLVENSTKSQRFETNPDGSYPPDQNLEYLGYRFVNDKGILKTSLSNRRMIRREKRLKCTFEAWAKHKPDPKRPNQGLDGLLLDRLKYLTGNIRLRHSKSNVVVGIYFSNSALSPDSPQLRELDLYLLKLIELHRMNMSAELEARARSASFVQGFNERTFLRMKRARVQRVVACWKGI